MSTLNKLKDISPLFANEYRRYGCILNHYPIGLNDVNIDQLKGDLLNYFFRHLDLPISFLENLRRGLYLRVPLNKELSSYSDYHYYMSSQGWCLTCNRFTFDYITNPLCHFCFGPIITYSENRNWIGFPGGNMWHHLNYLPSTFKHQYRRMYHPDYRLFSCDHPFENLSQRFISTISKYKLNFYILLPKLITNELIREKIMNYLPNQRKLNALQRFFTKLHKYFDNYQSIYLCLFFLQSHENNLG